MNSKFYSICYIIPYFGTLPNNFNLWLLGCKLNPSVNWIIITDDKSSYSYPNNVSVIYSTFDSVIDRIRKRFSFEVVIDRPWRLALFKSAYGEIFEKELKGYDFWGHCDIDLMWGDIRSFYTNDILAKYQRIGFLGHSTLYKNIKEVNARYKHIVKGEINYIDVYSGKSGYSFDENGMDAIYKDLGIPYYNEVILADLEKYTAGFFCNHFPSSDDKKNKRQIFTWEKGHVYRYYLMHGKIYKEEFLYIHFFCRPMKYDVSNISEETIYYMYPDIMTDKIFPITIRNLKKYGTRTKVAFIINALWVNRHKITFQRICNNIRNASRHVIKSTTR